MSMSAERIVEHIISANCDAGAAGREVLLALVAANLQEADESGSDREYEAKAAAQALLFQIATHMTQGYRWAYGETESEACP